MSVGPFHSPSSIVLGPHTLNSVKRGTDRYLVRTGATEAKGGGLCGLRFFRHSFFFVFTPQIGVQLAQILQRETFNLYRSLKLCGCDVVRCDADEIEELQRLGSVRRGVHSATLVPYAAGKCIGSAQESATGWCAVCVSECCLSWS